METSVLLVLKDMMDRMCLWDRLGVNPSMPQKRKKKVPRKFANYSSDGRSLGFWKNSKTKLVGCDLLNSKTYLLKCFRTNESLGVRQIWNRIFLNIVVSSNMTRCSQWKAVSLGQLDKRVTCLSPSMVCLPATHGSCFSPADIVKFFVFRSFVAVVMVLKIHMGMQMIEPPPLKFLRCRAHCCIRNTCWKC